MKAWKKKMRAIQGGMIRVHRRLGDKSSFENFRQTTRLEKSEGALRPPRLVELLWALAALPVLLPADAKRELNDAVGTGAGAECGRGRIAQAVEVGIVQVLVRTAASENSQSERCTVGPEIQTTGGANARGRAIEIRVRAG